MLIHPDFDPIVFSLGPLAVRWYGLMYLAGFAAAWWLGTRRISQGLVLITREQFEDVLFGAIVGVILGGRLGYVIFYKPGYYLSHPLEIFAIWQGGMSFHGGFLGVLLAMAFVAHRQRLNWWDVMDFVAPLVPIGIAAGRLGNFINGELWGRVTDLPWGMVFRGAGNLPRHPSATLRNGAGRLRAVRAAVVVLGAPSSALAGLGALPRRLRRGPLHLRIRARARQFPRFPRLRLHYGPMAQPADDRCRNLAFPARAGSLSAACQAPTLRPAPAPARGRHAAPARFAPCSI